MTSPSAAALECLDPYVDRPVVVKKRKYPSVRSAVVSLRFEDGDRFAEGGDLSTHKLARRLGSITGNTYSSSGYLADAASRHSRLLGLVPKEEKDDSVLTLAVTCLSLLQHPPSFRTALQAGLRQSPFRPASCPVSSLLRCFSERHSYCHCGTGRHSPDEEEDFSGEWVACDSCQRWFHLDCTPLSSPPSEDQEWECGRCGEFEDVSPSLRSLRRLVSQIRTSMRGEGKTLLPVKKDLSLLASFILSGQGLTRPP